MAGGGGEKQLGGSDLGALEEKLTKSILDRIRPEGQSAASHISTTKETASDDRADLRSKDGEFREAVLLAIGNTDSFTTEKIGLGYFDRLGDSAVDGIFVRKGLVLGVTVNTLDYLDDVSDEQEFRIFLRGLTESIDKQTFGHVFIVYDGEMTDAHALAAREVLSTVERDLAERVSMIHGSPEQIPAMVIEKLQGNATDAAE